MLEFRNKIGDAGKAAMWYLICNFLIKGISFITTPVFTRVMNTEEYGIVSTYNSYLAIISVIVTLDLYACIQISKKDFKTDNEAFVSSIMFLSSISVIFFYIILKIYTLISGNLFHLPSYMIDVMFVYIFFENAFNIRQTYLRANTLYKEFSICTLLFSIFSIVLGVYFVINMQQDKYWGRIIGSVVPMIIIGCYAKIQIYSVGHCFVNKSYWKYGLLFSLPLITHHISGKILFSFDRILINSLLGSSYVAIYSLAYNVGAIIEVILFSFNSAWTPWFYDRLTENNIISIKKGVKFYITTFCFFIVGAILVGPEIVKMLGPKEYWEGKWVIPPVAFGLLFQFLYGLYVNIEMYNKKTKTLAVGTVCAALLNVLLNSIFIPQFGYIAAAYTTLFGYFILFIFHYIIAGKIEKRDLFGKRFILLIIVLMSICSVIICTLYQTTIIRYIFILVLGIFIAIKYKEEIRAIF